MKARDFMTSSPCCASPADSVQNVAALMRDHDCGAIPVVDDSGCTVGVVTDRDLAVRALAEGKNGDTRVADVMTDSPCCGSVDDDLRDIEKIMADNQVRRVPIVDASGHCIGIISQADLARATFEGKRVSEHEVAVVVERISESNQRVSARRRSREPERRI